MPSKEDTAELETGAVLRGVGVSGHGFWMKRRKAECNKTQPKMMDLLSMKEQTSSKCPIKSGDLDRPFFVPKSGKDGPPLLWTVRNTRD